MNESVIGAIALALFVGFNVYTSATVYRHFICRALIVDAVGAAAIITVLWFGGVFK